MYSENVQLIEDEHASELDTDIVVINGSLANKNWRNMDAHSDRYLDLILREMSVCYTSNNSMNNQSTGLYMVGAAGGNAMNTCFANDTLGNASDW